MPDSKTDSAKANSGPGYGEYPGYTVDIEPLGKSVRIEVSGEVIAKTDRAILVMESRHKPVFYIPRSDVNFDFLQENTETTYCPFKGAARYWNIRVRDVHKASAVWGYDTPYDEVAVLSGYVSFYTDRVDAILLDGEPAT